MKIRVYKKWQTLGFFNELHDIPKVLKKKELSKASIAIVTSNRIQVISAKKLLSFLY